MTATATWRALLRDLLERGTPASQASMGAAWRGRANRELVAHATRWPMVAPVVLCPERRLGRRFLAAEAAWILSGDNRLAPVERYAPALRGLSGDGRTLGGAYGPPFVDQVPYVVGALKRDPASRQAVAALWRPRPASDPDCPCTLTLQWLLRAGALDCVATMRSSDAWTGIVYDVFAFSMMSAFVALALGDAPPALGTLHLTAGSQHLYEVDAATAARCAARDDAPTELAPLDLAAFGAPDDLVAHLWAVAERRPDGLRGGWLRELLA